MKLSLLLAAMLFFGTGLRGQEPGAVAAAESAVPEKAGKYYEALIKRPAAGYLFDRFYNSWVDAQTIEDLEKFLQSKAGSANATTNQRLVLAFFYSKQNEHPKALEQFRLALEKDPGNADAWFQKANAEVRTLDFESAIADLTKALESKPTAEMTRSIQQLQGRLLARTGKNEEAMKVWQNIIAAHPEDEELQEDLIELQINEGLNKEALTTAEHLLAKTRDAYKKVQRRLRIGDIQSRLGNRDAAIATYTTCLDEVGGDSWLEKEILSQIDQTFRRDDSVEALKAKFAELVAKYPQRITLRRAQARLLVEQGDNEGAIKIFQEILAITPGDRELREAYVSLLADVQKLDDAVAQLQQLISQHPQDIELLVKLAELHSAAGRKDEARKTLEDYLSKSDQSEQTYLRTAALLDRMKLGDASLAMYKLASEKFPDSDAAKENHAVALHREGRRDDALAAWRKMAEGADKARLMNVARQASARDEHLLAYELLAARLADLGNDPLFLNQLCDEAQRVDKSREAIPHALKLVSLAHDAVELDSALTLAARLIERSEETETQIASLKSGAKSAQERCLLAELLERGGDSKSAEILLQQVCKEQPEMGTALLVRLQTTRGDYAGAAKTMRRLVESPGGRKPVYVQRLVELFEKAGMLDKALAWVPEWKQLTPGSTQAWLREADLKASLGRMKEALLTLRQATQQFEGNEDIRSQLGAAYRSEGKLADAERVFTQLYEEAKEASAKVRWAGELAQTAEQSGKMAELVEAFEERRRGNRGSVIPLLSLAEIYRIADNYEGRRQVLLEAARIKRDDIDLLLEISRIAESQGDYDRALQTLRDALPLDKADKVKNRMARVLFAAGREDEARKLLYDMAGGPKMDARVAENLADSLMNQDEWKEAAELLAPAVERFPKDYRLAYQHAVSLEESGRKPEALAEFQRILSLKEEIPSTASSGSAPAAQTSMISAQRTRQGSWIDALRDLLPPNTLTFLELTQTANQATGYRQQQGGSYRRNAGLTGVVSKVSLPADVEESPKFALIHIAMLLDELNDVEKARLDKDLKSAGALPLPLLSLLQSGRFNYTNPDFAELMQSSPQDESINALASLYSAYSQLLTEEDRLRLFEFFKEKRPLLACLPVISTGRADSAPLRAAFAEAVGMIEKVDKPAYILVDGIGRLLNGGGAGEADDLSADPAYKALLDRLRARLMAWYRVEDRTNPFAGQLLSIVLQDVLKQEDPAELISLFEAEIASFQSQAGKPKPSSAVYNPYASMSRGSGNGAVSVATFPPQQLTDFPPFLLNLLGDANSNYYSRNWQPDLDKLKAALPTVKNSILKVLLASKVEDEATVSATLDSMLAAKEATLSPLLLASTWAAKKEKWEEAIAILHKAEYLPLTREQRRTADASILSWMLQKLDSGKAFDETAPDGVAAREAALRLRRDTLGADQKAELADSMERIGLGEEVKRLIASNALGAGGGSVGGGMAASGMLSGGRTSVTFNPGSTNRVDSLLQKGKPDVVIKLWQKQLRDLSKAWSSGFDDSLQYQAREWVQMMRQKMSAAEPELLKSMAPPEGAADPAAFAQAAAAMDIFGKRKEAREYYEKALELKPKDSNLRLVYVMFLMKEDASAASGQLISLDPKVIAQAGPSFSNIIDNLQSNSQRCSLARLVGSFVAGLQPAEYAKTDLSWLPYFIDQFARYGSEHDGDDDLPSLYLKKDAADNHHEKETPEEKKKRQAMDQLQAERRKLHDDLCLSASKIPQTARFAFEKLAGLGKEEGKSISELAAAARHALELEFGTKGYVPPAAGNGYSNDDDDEDAISFPSPEEVLLENALKQGGRKTIEEDIIPMLRDLKAQQPARDLEADAKLYFCESADFVTAAQNHVKRRLSGANPSQEATIWSRVIGVMEQRGLASDLAPAILAGLKKTAQNYYGGSELSHVDKYLKLLFARGEIAKGKEFLQSMTSIYLGPLETREDFLKKNFSPNSGNSSAGAAINKWLNFFRNVSGSGDVVTAMLECYHDDFVVFTKGSISGNTYFYINSSHLFPKEAGRSNAESMLAFLKKTPFLGDAASLRLFPLDRPDTCGYTMVLEALQSETDEDVEALQALLEKEPKTIGLSLALAFLRNDDQTWPDALNTIGSQLKDLQELPADRKNDWSVWLKYAADQSSSKNKKLLTEEGKAGLAWLQGLGGNSADLRATAILGAKSLQVAKITENNIREIINETLPELMAKDPVKATQFVAKIKDLFAQERRLRPANNNYYTDGASSLGYAFSSSLQEVSSKYSASNPAALINALNVLADAVCSKSGIPMEYGYCRSAALRILQALGTEKKGNESVLNYEKLITLLGEKLNPEQGRLYAPELARVISPTNTLVKKDRATIDAWLAKESVGGDARPHAWLASLVLQLSGLGRDAGVQAALHEELVKAEAARAAAEKRTPLAVKPPRHEGIYDAGKLSEPQRVLLELSQAPTWSPGAKFAVINSGCELLKDASEPALRLAAARLLMECWRNQTAISSVDTGRTLQRLASLDDIQNLPEDAKSTISETLAAWRRNALAQRNYNGGSSVATASALELACALKDGNTVNQVMTVAGESANRFWLARLVSAGQFEAAKRLVSSGRDGIFDSNSENPPAVSDVSTWLYSSAMESALPEFLKTLESPIHQFTARILLASLKDAPKEATGSAMKRPQRLAALAKVFPADISSNPELNERLLQLLLTEDAARDALDSKLLQAAGESISLASLPDLNNSTIENRKEALCLAFLTSRIQAGDLAPMQKAMRDLATAQSEDSYDLRDLALKVQEELSAATDASWDKFDATTRKANREFWRQLSFDPALSKNFDAEKNADAPADFMRLVHVLLLHAMDDALPEFNAAFEALQPDWKEHLKARAIEGKIVPVLQKMDRFAWARQKGSAEAQRAGYVLKMLQSPLGVLGSKGTQMRYFRELIGSKLLKEDDFLSHGDEFAKAFPNGGVTLVELSEIYLGRGNKEQARELLRRSREVPLVKMEELGDHAAWTVLMQAENFEKLEMLPEAIESLNALPAETLKTLQKRKHETAARHAQMLTRLAQEAAIAKGEFTGVLKPTAALLSAKPKDAAGLSELGSLFEQMGKALEKKSEFLQALDYYGASLMAYHAARLQNPKIPEANQIRANNCYHRVRRSMNVPTAPKNLLARRSAKWKYLDSGSEAPAGWQLAETDVSTWNDGMSPIGYGETDLGTTIEPNGEPKKRPITCYFRTTIEVPESLEIKSMVMYVRRDDGVAFYLNGKELVRNNLPEGPLTPATLASKSLSDQVEKNYEKLMVPVENLHKGSNTLAAEVHQAGADSSDLVLDVELVLNPSFIPDTLKALDQTKLQKTLGESWSSLPEPTREILLQLEPASPQAVPVAAKSQ